MGHNHLLWLDLETTGSATEDSIIEIGCALTDTDLNVLGEYTSLVLPTRDHWASMFDIPPVVAMHTANGLIRDIESGFENHSLPSVWKVEASVLRWLGTLGARPKHTYLAGSGVSHFDQRMLLAHLPALAGFCRFATIDIGVVRRMHQMFVGTAVSEANDDKTHRALDDVRCHLAETRAYVAMWRGTQLLPAAS